MKAHCIDKKSFQLSDKDEVLCELIYESLWHIDAKIKMGSREIYEIKSEGIFATRLVVTKNGIEVANLQMNWSGQMILSFDDGSKFIIKPLKIFGSKFVLQDHEKVNVAEFHPKFDWRKFDYNYEIEIGGNQPIDTLSIMLSIYAINYYIASMSGGTSGIG